MRNMGNAKKTITATPRQLESMVRVSESIARMRLSPQVSQQDVEEAVRLIKTAMQQSATDPKTGEIDMDLLTTGVSNSSKARVKEIADFIKTIHNDFRDKVNEVGIKYGMLFDYMRAKAAENKLGDVTNLMEKEFLDTLMQLENDGVINLIGHRSAPTIRFCNTD